MERGTASDGASLLKEFHPVQTLQQVENYTALSELASEYLLDVICSNPNAVSHTWVQRRQRVLENHLDIAANGPPFIRLHPQQLFT